jgi:uncharacterized spore protein YtfJ
VPECAHHAEVLRAGEPVRVGSLTLLPIERVVVHASAGARTAWFTAAKEPYALVVRDERGVRAIGVGGAEVSLEALREAIPGLEGA